MPTTRPARVSTTGTGEMFMRMVAAYDVAAQMRYAARVAGRKRRARVVMNSLPAIGGRGGLIAVDAHGNVTLPFNTEGMYRGFARVGERRSRRSTADAVMAGPTAERNVIQRLIQEPSVPTSSHTDPSANRTLPPTARARGRRSVRCASAASERTVDAVRNLSLPRRPRRDAGRSSASRARASRSPRWR